MKIIGKQNLENYLYLQKYIVSQTEAGEKGRLQIRNYRIFAGIFLCLSVLMFINGEDFGFIFLLILGIWFFCWSYFLGGLLTNNIRRSYHAFMKDFGEDVNMSIQVDENNVEIELGTIKISAKTCDIKRYMETSTAIIIHLDGPLYCGIFREETDDWGQMTAEIRGYAEKYNTSYLEDLTWSGNPYKKRQLVVD